VTTGTKDVIQALSGVIRPLIRSRVRGLAPVGRQNSHSNESARHARNLERGLANDVGSIICQERTKARVAAVRTPRRHFRARCERNEGTAVMNISTRNETVRAECASHREIRLAEIADEVGMIVRYASRAAIQLLNEGKIRCRDGPRGYVHFSDNASAVVGPLYPGARYDVSVLADCWCGMIYTNPERVRIRPDLYAEPENVERTLEWK